MYLSLKQPKVKKKKNIHKHEYLHGSKINMHVKSYLFCYLCIYYMFCSLDSFGFAELQAHQRQDPHKTNEPEHCKGMLHCAVYRTILCHWVTYVNV